MQQIHSVSDINRYIKNLISKDMVLTSFWVRGEISNYKSHYSGHMYFTLKDEGGLLKSVMFKTRASFLRFVPENGLKVIVRGYVSVYERDGQYQLYAEEMQPDGLGELHLAFEQLKKKLESEGLFDSARKKKIPRIPRSIGVITSSTGAVIRDIIHVLDRRYPNFNLKLIPVAVQGEAAAGQIAKALRKFNELGCVDVIIIARGGGSLEELWAFNEEVVARSIFESEIPVISAVGHETDYTIADFVSDLRAPTPSAAAEMVLPEKQALKSSIQYLEKRLKNLVENYTTLKRKSLQGVMNSNVFKQPFDKVYQKRITLDMLNRSLQKSIFSRQERSRAGFSYLAGKLDALSPLTVLARGYSVLKMRGTGELVKSINEVGNGESVDVCLKDGILNCIVTGVQRSEDNG